MRHALVHAESLHRPSPRGGLARHRPRASGRSRAGVGEARGTDVVLAVLGLAILGFLCLLGAARILGS